jgi:hypothetical protein
MVLRRVAAGVPLVARRILAALAGVRLAADPVHRDGQRRASWLIDLYDIARRKPRDDVVDGSTSSNAPARHPGEAEKAPHHCWRL